MRGTIDCQGCEYLYNGRLSRAGSLCNMCRKHGTACRYITECGDYKRKGTTEGEITIAEIAEKYRTEPHTVELALAGAKVEPVGVVLRKRTYRNTFQEAEAVRALLELCETRREKLRDELQAVHNREAEIQAIYKGETKA